VAFHTGSSAKIQKEQNALEFSDRKGRKGDKKYRAGFKPAPTSAFFAFSAVKLFSSLSARRRTAFSQFVTPERLNRGSSLKFVWIPAKSMRE
jgi:hypothetical protein